MTTLTSETTHGANAVSDRDESVKLQEITLPNRQLFEIKTPDGQISETGQSELIHYLAINGLPSLPEDFEWVWIGKRGTFPKRVQTFYYKEHKLKLTPEQISELGNKARAHTSLGETFICDFTNRFDWSSGDFGDGGSCFWGDRSGAREMLEIHGAYAVRAFKPAQSPIDSPLQYANVRGYARAWLVPIGQNRFVLFNAYGESAITFARLLALRWNCSYKKLELYNNGNDDGTLYINGSNYLIGEHSAIAPIESHDFGWSDIHKERNTCPCCEDYCDEDEMFYCESEDRSACGDCASHCVGCDEYFTRNIQPRAEYDYDTLCRSCYQHRLERDADEESEAQSESYPINQSESEVSA